MPSGFLFGLFLCLSSGLLAAACDDGDKPKTQTSGSCCPAPCPPGWTQFESRCYIFYVTGKKWVEAESTCLSVGGNLASVHNDDEHFFLKSYIKRSSGEDKRTWIGGFDSVKEGVWMWADGTKFGYNRWFTNEPNNLHKEHCMEMNWRDNFWNDWKCENALPFMCSKDV